MSNLTILVAIWLFRPQQSHPIIGFWLKNCLQIKNKHESSRSRRALFENLGQNLGQTDWQTDRQTDGQTYRQTDKQTDRQTNRQTDRTRYRVALRLKIKKIPFIDFFRSFVLWAEFSTKNLNTLTIQKILRLVSSYSPQKLLKKNIA